MLKNFELDNEGQKVEFTIDDETKSYFFEEPVFGSKALRIEFSDGLSVEKGIVPGKQGYAFPEELKVKHITNISIVKGLNES